MNFSTGVIVATYNGERYIAEQLNSIIKQDLKPNLIVISDGGSTDNTVEICHQVLDNSDIPFLILESEKQMNVVENFQRAYLQCNTDIVFFADQDDYWLNNKISSMINFFSDDDICLVFSNATLVDSNLSKMGKSLWSFIGYNKKNTNINIYRKSDSVYLKELFKHNIVTGMCMCVRKSKLNHAVPFSTNGLHDSWLSHMSILKGTVVSINQKLVLYRQHSNNVIGCSTNISKKMSNAKKYKDNLIKRILFIKDVILNVTDSKIINLYNEYLTHLNHRLAFINKKNFLYIFFGLIKYYKYEYKPLSILFKDVYIMIRGKYESK